MCGIAGIFSWSENAPPADRNALGIMHDRLQPRGPDGDGKWFGENERVALAHRRLSIIDLSEAGTQPMALKDKPDAPRIVYNGEIYNYRELRAGLEADGVVFRSQSDTEVLLHLYARDGARMVTHLRGMFALAVFDPDRKGVFLARDPYGIKPLYFSNRAGVFAFASQVRALAASGLADASPWPAGHCGFFLTGYVPEPHTLYAGIHALPAGHSMWVDHTGASEPECWCDISETLAAASAEKFEPERLRAALTDSVRAHMIADVPVGVFLSSGRDSATLAALAAEQEGSALRTVTLGFDEYRGTADDETVLAEEVAAHYGTDHKTSWISEQDFRDSAGHLFSAMDQPTIDGVNSFFVSKVTHEAGLKVALSGVGGDEIFGGYGSFGEIPSLVGKLGGFRYLPGLGKAFRLLSAPFIKRMTSPKYAGVIEYGTNYGDAYLLRRGLFMPWELPEILDPNLVREGLAALSIRNHMGATTGGLSTPRQRVCALESCWYMRNQLLRDADWAGMAFGLEIRTPLVDIELLRALAPMLAGTHPPGKSDMAGTPARTLPDAVLNRPKTGFSIPVREWLGAPGQKAGGAGYRSWARQVHAQIFPDAAAVQRQAPAMIA